MRLAGKRSRFWGKIDFKWRHLLYSVAVLIFVSAPGLAGEERFDYDELGRLIRVIDEQGRVTTYSYDPAGNLLDVVAEGAAQTPPTISSVSPDFVRAGEAKQIRITGSGLTGASVNTGDPRLVANVVAASASELILGISAATDTAAGARSLIISNAAGSATIPFTVRSALVVSTAPSFIAIPPDSSVRSLTIRLSDSDPGPMVFTVTTGNVNVASAFPNTVTLNSGQTEFQLTITGRQVAKTFLTISSPILSQPAIFPVYVTTDFANRSSALGVFLSPSASPGPQSVWGSDLGVFVQTLSSQSINSLPSVDVGVFVPAAAFGQNVNSLPGTDLGVWLTPSQSLQSVNSLSSVLVGVSFGPPQVMSISPTAGSPGSALSLIIRGTNLFDAGAVIAEPGGGITFTSAPTTTSDGTRVIVGASIASDAAAVSHVIRAVTPVGTSSGTAGSNNTFTIGPP